MEQEFSAHTFIKFTFNTAVCKIQEANTKNMNTHEINKKSTLYARKKNSLKNDRYSVLKVLADSQNS